MLEFFCEKVLPPLMLVLICVLAVIGGVITVEAATSSGPSAVLLWGFVVAAVFCAIGYFLGYMYFDMSDSDNPKRAALIVGLIVAVCAFWMPGQMYVHGHEEAVYLRTMAPRVKTFVGEHFGKLDPLQKGTIDDDDLKAALNNPVFNPEQRELIELMRNQISEVGHVTGSYTSTTFVWISTGNGGGYMSPITTTSYTYGISARDVDGYPERVVRKYSEW